jgi:hypothetical protein
MGKREARVKMKTRASTKAENFVQLEITSINEYL